MCPHSQHWIASEVLPSRLGSGDDFVRRMLRALEEYEWGKRDVFSIRLAVEEALVNAIRHGNCLDCDKEVHVECKVSSDLFWICITDQGSGFDPQDLPDPTTPENLENPDGRGVLLMQNFMTRVKFNEKGNQVEMDKIPTTTEDTA